MNISIFKRGLPVVRNPRMFRFWCFLWLFIPLGVLAQNAPPDSTEARPGPQPITEAGFYYGTGSSLLAGHFVAWEAGYLFRKPHGRSGKGFTLYLAADDDVFQFGVKYRLRRYISTDFLRYLEIAFGAVLHAGGRESEADRIDPPLFVTHFQFGLLDWLALTAQVQVVDGPNLDLSLWGGGGSSGNMNFHLGLSARKEPSHWLFIPLLAYLAAGGPPL